MKCLCKNGQNGDPSWKKSCSWSFNDAPWSASDLKGVQCKATQSKPQPTAPPTTPPTTQSTTKSTTVANPNTHRFCEVLDGWTSECSQCYSFTFVDNYFFNDENFNHYYEDFECEFKISTVCDPNFKDQWDQDCDFYAKNGYCNCTDENNCRLRPRTYLQIGVMTDKGFMTGFNCPQCGCDENGPNRFHDHHRLTGG